ncbi:cupin-like domain-containing protein [Aurantiacibacter hainanensis]|uniref:cupin-like domain-containing protein n=1 Tax=Aurantiacibacter hainanensis TaxID=3076114 RepID=UPI0030C6C364
MSPVEEIAATDPESFDRDIRPLYKPVVIRGAVADWPLIEAGKESAAQAMSYLTGLDNGAPTDLMIAPPSEKGRFFYSADLRGFNFQRQKASLSQLAQHLLEISEMPHPIGIYAGAAATQAHLPRFDSEHRFPLVSRQMNPVTRVWLGNATQVATHFDLSDNFAVVALGKRRFTLFPPEATPNLYVGPLDMTLAGQPVSMVDPVSPDLERYPRFSEAQRLGQVADLEPGDAIYIPTLWWHHVQASDPISVLVNYWHNDARHGGGFLALVHAILAIRDHPPGQREAWRSWFDHFVFDESAPEAAQHLPPHARTVTGPPSPQRDEMIRRFILQVLAGQ